MSYYRYAIEYPSENSHSRIHRSLVPPLEEAKLHPYHSFRLYTSEKDDSSACTVISLGHEYSWPNKKFGPRSIDRLILHYIIKGRGTFNGKPLSAGTFFFVKPYEKHTLIADAEDPMEFYYIGISGPGTESIIKSGGFLSIPSIQDCPFIDRIPELFYKRLYEINADEDVDFSLMSFFLQLVALHKHHIVRNTALPSDETYFYYKAALLYIQDSLLEGITPRDVAQYLHISPSYLRVIFAKYCKYSLRELLIRKRIECAASHLKYDHWSVSQAAALIGYDDYTLFSKIFKKYTGFSPQAYKKSGQEIDIIYSDVSNARHKD